MSDDESSGELLDVPYVSQGDDDVGCVWASVKMVIEYFVIRYPDIPNPDAEQVKKGVGYDKEGTPLEGVTEINKLLRGAEHELVFEWSDFAKFPDIEKDLTKEVPVIAWIKQNRESDIHHSVVIRGVNNTDLRVYVNDPDPDEPKEHSQSDFMTAWETGDRILIRARVGTRPKQRRLDESI